MVEIKDVPLWLTSAGIGHVVVSIRSGWTSTLCDTMVSFPGDEKEIPKRICRKCREKLKKATFDKSKQQN